MDKRTNGLGLFIAGSLLGAGVALLFAPQSGRKTRRDLRFMAEKAKNKSEALKIELRHAAENWIDEISEKLQEGMDRGIEWTDRTKQEVQHALESGKEYIHKELEKITHA